MSDRYSSRILEHIADRRYQPQPLADLADELRIPKDDLDEFRLSLEQLLSADQVVLSPSQGISLPPPGRQMTGIFRLHRRGFGFLVPDSATQHGDLFIPEGAGGGALTGDRVRATVSHQPGRARRAGMSPYLGRIVEIIQRAEKRYVGNLSKRGSLFIVEVDGQALHYPVIIRDPHAKNARPGDKVVVELTEYPVEDKPGEGVITQVLGQTGEPDVETAGVILAFGLPGAFPEEVNEQARQAALQFRQQEAAPEREDLTHETILTIDPPDARDFDDAIHLRHFDPQHEPDGASWELGVHIADVAFFVQQGSALDVEARARGNSTYLPRRVIPMLPEVLSNGVCSLQEGVPRYCKSAFIRYDNEGQVLGERFANTLIRSAKRLTYLEAQALIDGDLREARKHTRSEAHYPAPILQTLQRMNELAKVIRQRRMGQGMIVLNLPEVELVFDDSGRVIDAVPEDNSFTHTIIEMFMVEANEAAARLFVSLDVAMVRRIHPEPPTHDMGDLQQFAKIAGFHIPARPTPAQLQSLLATVRGKPTEATVNMAVLKTLSRAEYSPALIGHFALASKDYTHFTSPIRRYPDLIVHRGLAAYIDAKARLAPTHARAKALGREVREDERSLAEDALMEVSRHCSTSERTSEAAERDLRNYLVLDLLSQHLGDDFAGTVTGITSQGMYMQLDKYLVDGMIRTTELGGSILGGDRWRFDHEGGTLVAQRSGRKISIGNRFVVRVANVIPARRQLDLVIVGEGPDGAPKPKKHQQGLGAKKAQLQSHRVKKLRGPKRSRR